MPAHSTPVQIKKPRAPVVLDESAANSSKSLLFIATPLRRRSKGANLNSTPLRLHGTDDETERNQRAKEISFKRSLNNLPSSRSDSLHTSLNESIKAPVYNEEEVKVQIQICNKLFTENKITVKNAWQLQVIDLLKHIVGKDKNTDKNADILQTASQCLEVAGKVYGLRVDSIHADALRLAAQLARTFKQHAKDQKDGGDISDGAVEEDGEGAKKKKEKRKKKRLIGISKTNVVNHDPSAWTASLPKLESAIFSAKNDVSMSTNSNLLTNQLKMDHSGYKFMLLSKENSWFKNAKDTVVSGPQRKFPVTLPKVENFHLCFPFKDFVLDEWDPDDEKKELEQQQQQVLGEVAFDENGVPIHELDGSLHDVFTEPHHQDDFVIAIDEVREEEEMVPHFCEQVEFITDFMMQGTSSEYSHNTLIITARGKIDQIWAGPSHWKLKYIRPSDVTYTGRDIQKQQKTRKRKVHEEEEINPHAVVHDNPPDTANFAKFVQKRKVKYQDSKKLIVPLPDFQCRKIMVNIEFLMCLPFTKPKWKNQENEIVECDVPAYKYNNPIDNEYCPNNEDHVDDGPDLADDIFGNGDHSAGDTIVQENVARLAGDNLIEAPEMVTQAYVPFALRAKKMDMRKLKLAIWRFLTKSDKEEIDPDKPIIRTTFSELYKNLPTFLVEAMKQELSCALAFSALLHLANDLYLLMPKRQDDITDFDIYK